MTTQLPYKFEPARVERLLEGARLGAPLKLIAERGGITRHTLASWLENLDKLPELEQFGEQFRAALSNAHLSLHASVVKAGQDEPEKRAADGSVLVPAKRGDWRASAFVLERTVEGYQPEHLGLGPRPEASNPALTEAQVRFRFIQSIAHPTRKMREALREAILQGNDELWQLVTDLVHQRSIAALGETVEEGSAPLLATAPPPMTVELEGRLALFADVLTNYKRVALGGGPKSGKTEVFSAACTDRPVVHTDAYISGGKDTWEQEAQRAKEACDRHSGPLLVEGVRVTGVLAAGLNIDVLVWLAKPLVELTKGQETMRKGRETRLARFRAENPDLRVVVI